MTAILQTLKHLHDTPFCMVYMEVIDINTEKVKLTPIHGRARILSDRFVVEEPCGTQNVVPDSALPSILPSDGTALLKDATHYVIVRVGTAS